MTGNEVINSGGKGSSVVRLDCTIDEYPNERTVTAMTFGAMAALEYMGNNTYEATEKTYDNLTGIDSNIASFKQTLALEDSNTLRYTYWAKYNEASTTLSVETSYEIVLKRAGTTNDNDGNDNDSNNNVDQPVQTQPVQISGKWEISSGNGTIIQDNITTNLTYTPGSVGKLELNVVQNDSGEYEGFYSVKLSGPNMTRGVLYVDCTVDGSQGGTQRMMFVTMNTFEYIGNGTYQCTEKNGERINLNADTFTCTLKLEGSDTLRWTQESRKYDEDTGSTTELRFEIVLKKAQ